MTETLFDLEPDKSLARPFLVRFLAGLFATWLLGLGRKPSKAQLAELEEIARDALNRVGRLS